MGANKTQASALVLLLACLVLLAGALAGGGMLLWLGFLVLLACAVYLFLKCKPWEHQND